PRIASVLVRPEASRIHPGESVRVRLYGRHEDGSEVELPAMWTASGGVVTAAGIFTAGDGPGEAVISGSARVGRLPLTARTTLVISLPEARPVDLHIDPPSARLAVGEKARFTATVMWSDGKRGHHTVAYATDGGEIDPN